MKRKRVIEKNWDLVGIEPMPSLAEREGVKKRKEGEKKNSPQN